MKTLEILSYILSSSATMEYIALLDFPLQYLFPHVKTLVLVAVRAVILKILFIFVIRFQRWIHFFADQKKIVKLEREKDYFFILLMKH